MVCLDETSGGHVGGVTSKCRRSVERKINAFLFIKYSNSCNMAIHVSAL